MTEAQLEGSVRADETELLARLGDGDEAAFESLELPAARQPSR
jgi:hypothetical protein